MNVQRSPSRAVAWMVAAVACFSLMDAGMKQLSAGYPSLQVTFLRGAASLPFVLVWVLASAGPRSLIPRRWGLHLLRWVAIGIGLVGVLVVLRPGVGGFISVPGLMVLAAATAYAIAAITVSLLTRTDTSQSMVVWFLVIMAIGAGLLAIPGWVPLQMAHAPLIAGMGLAGALGQIALTKAFQLGEASMIAPLEYSGLVWVIGWDLAFWGQLPDGYTWAGAAIIVASGLYLLHRERVNRQEPPKPLDHP